jgi:hypothetical protein
MSGVSRHRAQSALRTRGIPAFGVDPLYDGGTGFLRGTSSTGPSNPALSEFFWTRVPPLAHWSRFRTRGSFDPIREVMHVPFLEAFGGRC